MSVCLSSARSLPQRPVRRLVARSERASAALEDNVVNRWLVRQEPVDASLPQKGALNLALRSVFVLSGFGVDRCNEEISGDGHG